MLCSSFCVLTQQNTVQKGKKNPDFLGMNKTMCKKVKKPDFLGMNKTIDPNAFLKPR